MCLSSQNSVNFVREINDNYNYDDDENVDDDVFSCMSRITIQVNFIQQI